MPIYLDHAATTPVCSAAVQAAVTAMTQGYGNPSSVYPLGISAARDRDAGRAVIAQAMGCLPEEVFFTSCGTESNNWAIHAAVQLGRRKGSHIVTTAIEHASVLEPIKLLQRQGFEVTYLRPDKTGHIDPSAVKAAVRPDTILVSMMLINNELGTLLPVSDAARAIEDCGSPALLHVDAVQGFLKHPFRPADLGADFLSVSGHKIRAPKGIGALYIKKTLLSKVAPLMSGGGQEQGLRPGTEATAQIAAFAAAVEVWQPETAQAIRQVKDYAADTLSAIPGVELIAQGDAPHILALSLPAFSGQSLVEALGGQGVYISSGSACHRGKPSHVFAAMPLSAKTRLGAFRVSFGPDSTRQDVDVLAQLLRHICQNQTLLFGR